MIADLKSSAGQRAARQAAVKRVKAQRAVGYVVAKALARPFAPM